MRRLGFGVALLFTLASASCAFLLDTDELKDGTGSSAPEPIPIEQFSAGLAGGSCELLARCAGPAMDIFFFDEDCATLTTRELEDGLFGLIQASIDNGRAKYDPQKAALCIESFESMSCADFDRWAPICDEALRGLVTIGGECGHAIDCEPGAFCDVSLGLCPGTCAAKASAGSPCWFEDMCQDGLKCFNGTCTAPGLQNEPCGGPSAPDCQVGFLCLGQVENQVGKCLAVEALFTSGEGIGCNLSSGPLCQEGLHCAISSLGVSGECVRPSLSGGPCRLSIPDACPSTEYCRVTEGVDGVCTALPGANQECSQAFVFKPPCVAYHRCVGDTCQPLRRLDEPCAGDGQCYSGYCEPGSMLCKTPGGCEF